MKICSTKLACAALLASGLTASGLASAQSTWNLVSGSGCSQNAGNTGNFGNSFACTGVGTAGTSATASAWSNDRGSAGTAQGGSGWANAYMSPQGGSGFGTASRTEGLGVSAPDHSVDSIAPGTYDFIMVQFASATILDQFRIGWGAADSDITVMRWAGAGLPTGGTGAVTTGGNATLSNTIGGTGWQLVNSYANVCRDGANAAVVNNNCSAGNSTVSTGATSASSYWLISAYNTTMDTVNGLTAGNDGFKLNWLRSVNSVNVTPSGVPEPSSVALLAAAALGFVAMRRRKGMPV